MVKYRNVAKKRFVESETSKFITNVQPFILMILVGLAGAIFHKLWSEEEYLNLVIAGMSISIVVLTYFTWDTSRHRGDIGRYHSATTTFLIGVWILFATIYGVTTHPMIDIYIIGGLTLALTWSIRTAIKSNAPERQDSLSDFFDREGMPGARIKILEKTAARVKARIRLKPGQNTAEDVQKASKRLASFLQVPATGIRVSANSDNASVADITIVKKDMLKTPMAYPHESSSDSINDPINIGVYEDADPALLPLQTSALGASHMLIQGMNGSGKSVAAQIIFLELFKRRDVISWVIDTVKGSQTLGALARGIDWVIDDENTANNLFRRFKNIIRSRADYLGSQNLDKWEPGCGLSFLHVHIEEASGLIANNKAFIKMMETARSVGIQITASLQRASHISIDTAARAQFSSVLCFGVANDMDARFALPDEVMDAGANPAAWRNSKPGYAYLVAPGIDQEKWANPLRTYRLTRTDIERVVDNIDKDPLDSITREAIGDLYRAKDISPVEEDYEENDSGFEDEVVSDDAVMSFGSSDNVTVDRAKKMLDQKIEGFKADNQFRFSMPDLKEIVLASGKSRTWLYKELQKLVDEGQLERDGFYYIIM